MTKECSQQLMKDEKRPDEEKLVQETLGKKGNELLTYPDHHPHLAIKAAVNEAKFKRDENEEDSNNEADDESKDDDVVTYAGKSYHDPS
uniref:Uncharacterized protein n=1 Tax=Glossina morsitans morsitans TaxID=37546 RepID=A0A1B0GCM4_GLOMM